MSGQRTTIRAASRPLAALVLAVTALPLVAVSATPAAATTTASCKSASGKASFTPPLPKKGSAAKVSAVFAANGTVRSCTGAKGLTGGTTKFKSAKSGPMNCTTYETYDATVFKGTETITWNTRATTSIALTVHKVKGKPTEASLSGTVIAGLFKGAHFTGLLAFTWPSGACTSTSLSSFAYKGIGADVFSTNSPPPSSCSDNSDLPHDYPTGNPRTGLAPGQHFYLSLKACHTTLTAVVNIRKVIGGACASATGTWKMELKQGTSQTTLLRVHGPGPLTLNYPTASVGSLYRLRIANIDTCTATAGAVFKS